VAAANCMAQQRMRAWHADAMRRAGWLSPRLPRVPLALAWRALCETSLLSRLLLSRWTATLFGHKNAAAFVVAPFWRTLTIHWRARPYLQALCAACMTVKAISALRAVATVFSAQATPAFSALERNGAKRTACCWRVSPPLPRHQVARVHRHFIAGVKGIVARSAWRACLKARRGRYQRSRRKRGRNLLLACRLRGCRHQHEACV